jgi:Ca2+-binding RTX toxin-like protein
VQPGPTTVDGGDGNDNLSVSFPNARIDGGPGDDYIGAVDGQTIVCGPGADTVFLNSSDRVGAGCAPHVGGLQRGAIVRVALRTRSLRITGGALDRRAIVTVTVRQPPRTARQPGRVLAQATRVVPAGPLRVNLRLHRAGVRALGDGRTRMVGLTLVTRSPSGDGDTERIGALGRVRQG